MKQIAPTASGFFNSRSNLIRINRVLLSSPPMFRLCEISRTLLSRRENRQRFFFCQTSKLGNESGPREKEGWEKERPGYAALFTRSRAFSKSDQASGGSWSASSARLNANLLAVLQI